MLIEPRILLLPALLMLSPSSAAPGPPSAATAVFAGAPATHHSGPPASPPAAGQAGAGEVALACTAPEARAFDFWHGEWKVNNRYLTANGWQDAGSADVRVYPALDGCLTIEHWRGNLGDNEIYGFSVRAWDESSGRWVLVLSWPQPEQAGFSTLEGTFRHGRGEFFAQRTDADGNVTHTRYSFADISADAFRWDQAFSTDGESWRTDWIMEYSRREPFRDAPMFVEPATSSARCAAEVHRDFDFLLGEWTATTEVPRSDGSVHQQQARMRAVPILGGCAVMDFWETVGEEPEFKAFRMRVYSAAEGRWLQYWFDTVERVFQRFESDPSADGLVLVSRVGDRVDRITWSDTESDAPGWTYEMSFDAGATWRRHASARLQR